MPAIFLVTKIVWKLQKNNHEILFIFNPHKNCLMIIVVKSQFPMYLALHEHFFAVIFKASLHKKVQIFLLG